MGSITREFRLWRRHRRVKCRVHTNGNSPRSWRPVSICPMHTLIHTQRMMQWIAVSLPRLLNTANPSKMQQVARVKWLMEWSVRQCALNNDIALPNEWMKIENNPTLYQNSRDPNEQHNHNKCLAPDFDCASNSSSDFEPFAILTRDPSNVEMLMFWHHNVIIYPRPLSFFDGSCLDRWAKTSLHVVPHHLVSNWIENSFVSLSHFRRQFCLRWYRSAW